MTTAMSGANVIKELCMASIYR